MATYYHVIEDGGNGNIAARNCYRSLSEAEAEVNRLNDLFPHIFFYVYSSSSKREPEFVTI